MSMLSVIGSSVVATALLFCPVCKEEGQKSKVYPDMYSTSTTMGYQSYYDEDGNYVHNDPNIRSQGFRCSRGHEWVKSTQRGETTVEIIKGKE